MYLLVRCSNSNQPCRATARFADCSIYNADTNGLVGAVSSRTQLKRSTCSFLGLRKQQSMYMVSQVGNPLASVPTLAATGIANKGVDTSFPSLTSTNLSLLFGARYVPSLRTQAVLCWQRWTETMRRFAPFVCVSSIHPSLSNSEQASFNRMQSQQNSSFNTRRHPHLTNYALSRFAAGCRVQPGGAHMILVH